MKKLLVVLIVTVLISGFVFATGSKEASAKSDVVVSMWTGIPRDHLAKVQDTFPGSSNIIVDEVGYGSLKQKQLLSFQSAKGTAGNLDVVFVNGPWMSEFVNAGYLMSLDDLAAAAGVDLGAYDSALISNLTFDGKTYGIPTFLQCIVCAYDGNYFKENNIKVPTNYDELLAVAKQLKAKGTGIAMPASQANGSYTTWSQLLYSADGYIVQDGKLDLTSDTVVASLERYKALVDNSCDGALNWAHEGVTKALQSKVAPLGLAISGNNSYLHDPSASLIADSVRYFPFYGYGNTAAANQTYWVWAIPANCSNPKAAFEFIAWVTSYDYEKKATLDSYSISGLTALAKDKEVVSKVPFAGVVMEAFSNGKPDPINPNFDSLKSKMNALLSGVAASSKPNFKALLSELQSEYGAKW